MIDNQDGNDYNYGNSRYFNRNDNSSYRKSKIDNSRMLASMLKMETGLSSCSTKHRLIFIENHSMISISTSTCPAMY